MAIPERSPLCCFAAWPCAAQAQNFSTDGPRPPHHRSPRRRSCHLGHAGGQFRPDASGGDRRAKGKPNQVVYWSRLPDWKNQTLTPNPDVIYLMPFFDTKDTGPM